LSPNLYGRDYGTALLFIFGSSERLFFIVVFADLIEAEFEVSIINDDDLLDLK
jgi:hypothetical protein